MRAQAVFRVSFAPLCTRAQYEYRTHSVRNPCMPRPAAPAIISTCRPAPANRHAYANGCLWGPDPLVGP